MTITKSTAMAALSRIGTGAPKTVGGLLALYRRTEELSQREVAEKLGISTTYLSDIENGNRRVSPGTAAEYAKKLGMPVSLLVARSLQEQLDDAGIRLKVSVEAD